MAEQVDRQVAGAWQVRGPPLVSSLQVVKSGTAAQSDVTEQSTEEHRDQNRILAY